MVEGFEHLEYLRSEALKSFSADMFGSSARLPVLGAIYELTPDIEHDRFYNRQLITLLGTDVSNTFNEVKRTVRIGMIFKEQPQTSANILYLGRVASPRWDIIRVALDVAKTELSIS